MYTIGIDLGGTKIATALVNEQGEVVQSVEVPTRAHEGPDAVIDRMEQAARDVVKGGISRKELRGVGVGAPGPLNPRTGMVYGPPNLPGWDKVPLREELARRLEIPVILENDANVAALAEATIGAGSGVRDVVYITVSTGIGGGAVLDGSIWQGSSGCAAEVGHMIVDTDGSLCPCGNHGCLETFASGTAIRRMAKERLGRDMGAKEVAELAAGGNSEAHALLAEVYRYLGVGLINVVQMFDPNVIVIGGGVAQIGKPMFDALQQAVDNNHFRSAAATPVRVLPAKLGTRAGVIGAALLPLKLKEANS